MFEYTEIMSIKDIAIFINVIHAKHLPSLVNPLGICSFSALQHSLKFQYVPCMEVAVPGHRELLSFCTGAEHMDSEHSRGCPPLDSHLSASRAWGPPGVAGSDSHMVSDSQCVLG